MTNLVRAALLAGSRSPWLSQRATHYRFVRRSVSRFMPGECVSDALGAARELRAMHFNALLTELGENVDSADVADAVVRHYADLLNSLPQECVGTQISVKLTQLGLDLGADACLRRSKVLVDVADATGSFVWLDMEQSEYVDKTLDIFGRLRAGSARVGVCLQAYLYRTTRDLAVLAEMGAAVRLVKGAYNEPAHVAFPRKGDVDQNFFDLVASWFRRRYSANFLAIGTHDRRLIERIRRHISAHTVPMTGYEFTMLYGVQQGLQRELCAQNEPVRVLISYGAHWFPWYMRRLAERPANILFVARNLFA